MARDLPAVLPGGNGGKPARDAQGRFVAGAPPGPGRPANPFARYQAELRGALLAEVSPADVRTILRQVLRIAKRGHLPAVELLLKWVLGAPPAPVDPDRLDEHELSVKRGRPTLLDQLTLADAPADHELDPAAAAEADAGEDLDAADLPPPPLQQMLSWALRELAAVQLRAAPAPPPDPAVSWERFAASHVEADPQAAVEVDQLYLSYARWCASHGEPVWAEAQVLAALQATGASLRTGTHSGVRSVVGVRVTA
jgi:hypothetical protein